MGGALKSLGGFLGLEDGPKAPAGNFSNSGLTALNNYVAGNPDGQETGAATGSKYATDQVLNNPMLKGLYGQGGQMSQEMGQYGKQSDYLNKLQNQGFELKPEDQTMYGQMSGDIARMFGQQGNQTASNLASRGLSNSGAAGAAFSGLAGNQNEMLAKAQQNIAQQRFQNTMGQIGQTQNFLSNLGGNINNMGNSAEGAINQQYNRQLAGAQHRMGGMAQAAGLQGQANNQQNQYQMDAAKYEQENKPANFMDAMAGGTMSSLYQGAAAPGRATSSIAGSAGSMLSKGLFA